VLSPQVLIGPPQQQRSVARECIQVSALHGAKCEHSIEHCYYVLDEDIIGVMEKQFSKTRKAKREEKVGAFLFYAKDDDHPEAILNWPTLVQRGFCLIRQVSDVLLKQN
jgi:hypothetical protein